LTYVTVQVQHKHNYYSNKIIKGTLNF